MVELFLTNANAYVANGSMGRWIVLPCDEEVLDRHIQDVLIMGGGEEILITDYHAPFSIDTCEDVRNLNKILKEVAEIQVKTMNERNWRRTLDFSNMDLFALIVNSITNSFDHALTIMKDKTFQIVTGVESLADVARMMLASGYIYDVGTVPKHLKPYLFSNLCEFEAVLENNVGWHYHNNMAACIFREENPIFSSRKKYCKFVEGGNLKSA